MNGVMQLRNILLFPAGSRDSCIYASSFLQKSGIPLTDHPCPEITHLLLDIPSFDASGNSTCRTDIKELLRMLPPSTTIIGGNLDGHIPPGCATMDLMKDTAFLAENAAITAECALRVAAPYLTATFTGMPVLILGWGRIGKHLSRLLSALGSDVTVSARKESDRALIRSLGYHATDYSQLYDSLSRCRILFNTVPCQTINADILDRYEHVIKIDLASFPGMICKNVITARGLPGKYAPETAGHLIAQTILRSWKEAPV